MNPCLSPYPRMRGGGIVAAGLLLGAALLMYAADAGAQAAGASAGTTGGNGPLQVLATPGANGSTTYSVSLQTLLIFAALSFLPAVLLMMTSFTRIVIVLSLMRQALGLQTTPPNQVIIGMSLFLTFFVMAPTFERVHQQAWQPYNDQTISFETAAQRAGDEMRVFMLRQTRPADLRLFATIAKLPEDLAPEQTPLRALIPAFVVSELKTAFQIGFLVFIPFLIIDLVVASVLMSMGMMMLSPVLVALPFKLMLFVLADGWQLLVGSMVASFGAV